MIQSVEADPWGLPYTIVTKKLNRKPPGVEARDTDSGPPILRGAADRLAAIPVGTIDMRSSAGQTTELTLFTASELEAADKKLSSGKASDPDNVTNEVLRIFIRKDHDGFLHLLNTCWKNWTFPGS